MYRRFLNDTDYLGIITPEALAQMTRGNSERFVQAEESAEMSIVEHLSENYEIERELNKGKYIATYDRRITFPVGAHIYHEGVICEVIRSISGCKAPAVKIYWQEHVDTSLDTAPCRAIPNSAPTTRKTSWHTTARCISARRRTVGNSATSASPRSRAG